MIFKKLELKNFKSHENTTLILDNGITLIVGENGAGKSSIFEAITFALFTHSEVKTLGKLVRTNKGLKNKIEMEVNLTFHSNGDDYRVERKVIRTLKQNLKSSKNKSSEDKYREVIKSESYLFKLNGNGKQLIASSVKEVNDEIKEILMMDSTTFLSAIHIRQGQISKLIDDAPHKRKELIGQLLKLDDLKRAHENIRVIIQDMQSKNEVFKGNIQSSSELNSQLQQSKADYVSLTEKGNVLQTQTEELENILKTKTQERDKLDAIKEKYDGLHSDLARQEEIFESLNKYNLELTDKLLEISQNEKEIEILKPYGDKLKRFTEFKDNHLKLNNLKIDEANKKEIVNQNESYKETILKEKENNDKYLELSKEIEELENTKKALSFEIDQLKDLESKKITLTNDISEYEKQLDEFYNQSKGILKDFDLEKNIDDATLEDLESIVLIHIEDVECEISQIDAKREEYVGETVKLKHEIDSTNESLEDISKVENRCPTCQSEITEVKKEELINSYNTTILTNSKKIEEINFFIDEMKSKKQLKDNNLANLNSIKNKLESNKIILDNITKLTGEADEIKLKIEGIESKKETLNDINSTLESKQIEFKNLESSHKEYELASNLLKSEEEEQEIKNQLILLSKDVEQIEQKLESLIKEESELHMEIGEDELNNCIEDLNEKNSRFLVLVGSVKDKPEFEEKLKINTQEIEKVQNTIETIKKTIEDCNYNKENHDELIKLVDDLDKNFKDMNINIILNDSDLRIKKEEIANLEKTITENNNAIKKVQATEDYIKLLNDFRRFYSKDGIQKDLREGYKESIQKYARIFFEKFNFNYSDLKVGEEYDISLRSPEGLVNLDMVSGGEKIAIALSLRLAITQVMSKGNIETILLDEPTIHLDSFRRQELINVLRSMAIIPQMIIVTHDEELENAADRIIKLKKEDGISRIVEE